jgi:hypothetical protein
LLLQCNWGLQSPDTAVTNTIFKLFDTDVVQIHRLTIIVARKQYKQIAKEGGSLHGGTVYVGIFMKRMYIHGESKTGAVEHVRLPS